MSTETKGGVLAKLSALFCQQPEFRRFLDTLSALPHKIETPQQAADMVRQLAGVGSRREFDTDPAAAERFHCFVRIPYVNWQLGRRA